MTFVDTSAWVARVVTSDFYYKAAREWMLANPRQLITTDYIIDEMLTWLRSHDERRRIAGGEPGLE